jgi:hypothetical protein
VKASRGGHTDVLFSGDKGVYHRDHIRFHAKNSCLTFEPRVNQTVN